LLDEGARGLDDFLLDELVGDLRDGGPGQDLDGDGLRALALVVIAAAQDVLDDPRRDGHGDRAADPQHQQCGDDDRRRPAPAHHPASGLRPLLRPRERGRSSASERAPVVPVVHVCSDLPVEDGSGGRSAALLQVQRGLQDEDRGDRVDPLPPLLRRAPGRLQDAVGLHGREPLVDEPDRHVHALREGAEERERRVDGAVVGPVERARPARHDLDRIVLLDEVADAADRRGVLIAADVVDRCREDPVGVADRRPDADAAHVECEPPAPAEPGHDPAIAAATASRAWALRLASCPPPWARSGLPPPPPPSSWQADRTRSPARRPRAWAPASAATTTLGLPLTVPTAATTTASASILLRTSVTKLRTSPASDTSPSCVAE